MKNRIYIRRAGLLAAMLAAMLAAILCLSCLTCLPLAAEEVADRVYDPADLLTPDQTEALNIRLGKLSAEYDVEMYLATYRARDAYDDFYGDEYCHEVRNLRGSDAVLLVVTYEERNRTYYYDMYTYGEANRAINQKEADYVLDRDEVYGNIKGGNLAEGAEAFFTLSGQAFVGRVGASWTVIITVSAIIAVVIALAVCGGVVAFYKRRHATVDYPLDRYASLKLTREVDAFVREYTTRTRISGSSGGGGGSRHGGGGGHRGGR